MVTMDFLIIICTGRQPPPAVLNRTGRSAGGFYDAQALWGLAVKIFSNVVVVVLNYVFSKLIVFKKK